MIFIIYLESIVLSTRNRTMLDKYIPNGYLIRELRYNIDNINFFSLNIDIPSKTSYKKDKSHTAW